MFITAGGKCASCGVGLGNGFHADHIDPWSKGGPTDAINGQALCASCNLKKGNQYVTNLRDWQSKFLLAFSAKNSRDFLLSATPGAGKTVAALTVARRMILAGEIERVVVVVPTTTLRRQWERAAASFQINLDAKFDNGRVAGEAADMDGVAVTYQAVGSLPDLYRNQCQKRTLVILDEIHHAGDERAWGDAIRHAFEHAVKRLAITGTPFRMDGKPIPFVSYGSNGSCLVDYAYTYGNALDDNVVRPIYAPSYEAEATWFSTRHGEVTATFSDMFTTEGTRIDEQLENQRLRTVISADSDWVGEVFAEADKRLLDLRTECYPAAAGIVFADDQNHARLLADRLRRVTGSTPVIAVSDDPDASERIAEFKKAGEAGPRWIVAVKMISEGVDVPRLMVGVWCTTTMSELFFRQVVGRLVRWIPGVEMQAGYLFIPAHPPLIDLVTALRQERDASIVFDVEKEEQQGERESWDGGGEGPEFTPYGATPWADATYITGDTYSASEIEFARNLLRQEHMIGISPEALAQLLRAAGRSGQADRSDQSTPVVQHHGLTQREKNERLRSVYNKKVNAYVNLIQANGDQLHYGQVHAKFNREQGVADVKDATADQLTERITTLNRWLRKETKRASA